MYSLPQKRLARSVQRCGMGRRSGGNGQAEKGPNQRAVGNGQRAADNMQQRVGWGWAVEEGREEGGEEGRAARHFQEGLHRCNVQLATDNMQRATDSAFAVEPEVDLHSTSK